MGMSTSFSTASGGDHALFFEYYGAVNTQPRERIYGRARADNHA
jgi:hypothetical protein